MGDRPAQTADGITEEQRRSYRRRYLTNVEIVVANVEPPGGDPKENPTPHGHSAFPDRDHAPGIGPEDRPVLQHVEEARADEA